ncbi:hypothetical protein RND71_010835 [Anisodus tanguticus]|uniref:Uncharacterized protein n=1 Tax=Anisodus tanguticus TaxID=243964 RepID=A0AAE1SKI8_9SOLA|nr:hypothetical protein RND71_010835 [Anisodus tanguticus]
MIICILALLCIQEVAIFQNSYIDKACLGIGMWPLVVSARRRPSPPPPPPPKSGTINRYRIRPGVFPPPPPPY